MAKNNVLMHVAIVLLSLSFWSSGVFLIRILNAYQVREGGISRALLFAFSIPLVYLSILSVQKMFRAMGRVAGTATQYIIALVLILHALALCLYPGLYTLVSSPALSATAWLLWFGGTAIILAHIVSPE